MACPGLHSIYSKVTVTACAAGGLEDGVLSFVVKQADPRFRRVQMDVRAQGLTGTVSAIARMPPVPQLTLAEVVCHVVKTEFATVRALIIGGSRGLGEVTAKIIAAGGGRAFITYSQGLEDAQRVQVEIRAAGGFCEIEHYDALAPVGGQLDAKTLNVTQLYYFATPRISRPKRGQYDAGRFAEFAEFYVNGFHRLCIAARESSPDGLSVFYPSSEFVSEPPSDMTEYAMAKAAGEVLCAELSREVPGLRVISSRLPRLLTDQTSTFLSSDIAEPLETLLPIVRSLGG
jgi:NAD(P)-dependent dehydrogenase (short-subunit alcohol dehydrogenase family)